MPQRTFRLALIFASVAIIFLFSALIVQQTIKQNQERVMIIQEEQVLGETEEVGQLSVNDATLEELDAISGIGPKTAEIIIAGRPWQNVEEALNLISKRYREEARRELKL